jgi:hypothetical protein
MGGGRKRVVAPAEDLATVQNAAPTPPRQGLRRISARLQRARPREEKPPHDGPLVRCELRVSQFVLTTNAG